MNEYEVINIDNKDYLIVNEINHKGTTYIYLVNPKNEADVMIRKSSKQDPDLYVPLENDDEFNLANLLLFKNVYKKQKEY